jgi:hypothetical protein
LRARVNDRAEHLAVAEGQVASLDGDDLKQEMVVKRIFGMGIDSGTDPSFDPSLRATGQTTGR